jgi:hypothetical protein
MRRILATITTLDQHEEALRTDPEAYRPQACPHCGLSGLWRHGFYHRKADRSAGAESRNPVQVLRFLCNPCQGTCSRLPLCIAPRRWYDWGVQQIALLLLLSGCSLAACTQQCGLGRHTLGRWRAWLSLHSETFKFWLCSRFPELGRIADHALFWRHVFDTLSLARAMAWLDQEITVPCPEVRGT